MAEIPRRFVRTLVQAPNRPLELMCAHSLFSFAKQQSSHEPFRQRQMGIMEDRASGNGELIIAFGAIEQLVAGNEPDNFLNMATWAFGTVRPAQSFKQFTALVVGREHFNDIRESHSEHPV